MAILRRNLVIQSLPGVFQLENNNHFKPNTVFFGLQNIFVCFISGVAGNETETVFFNPIRATTSKFGILSPLALT